MIETIRWQPMVSCETAAALYDALRDLHSILIQFTDYQAGDSYRKALAALRLVEPGTPDIRRG